MARVYPLPSPDFSSFYKHDALTALLQEYEKARPDILELRELGRSYENRPIWLLVITRKSSGPDTDKPAFWVDGNIHAAELTASTACLYWLHQLLSLDGTDPSISKLLETRVVYMVPRLNPDGAELALADKPRHIRSSTRSYPWDEPHVEGLTVEDIDGDGRILMMRIEDPHGGWKINPDEPRLLTPRLPGEFGGVYYRVVPEGRVQNFDGVNIKPNRDREGLDLNRNFPALWRQEFEQTGAGPYPTSEPEVRAMVDFVVKHPNIGAAVSFHTHSGVILRPMSTQSDEDMTPEDLWMYQRLSDIGSKMTGYPTISTFHDFKYHPKEIITGTQDWLYEHLGALFWTVEIWAPNKEAGIEKYDWVDWYREHPPKDDQKLLAWSDAQCHGKAHVDWYAFEHPQLGKVEIGGWDRLNYWRNPPAHLREREAARFPGWLTSIALTLPKLELISATAESLGADQWRIRMAVANSGYLPSYVTKRALERKVARPCIFEIQLPADAQLVMGAQRIESSQLEGHAATNSLQAFFPSKTLTADRATAEWIIHAPLGSAITLHSHAARAGHVYAQLVLQVT